MGNSLNESNLVRDFTHTKSNYNREIQQNESDYFSNNDSYNNTSNYNPYGPSAKTRKFIEKIAPNLKEATPDIE